MDPVGDRHHGPASLLSLRPGMVKEFVPLEETVKAVLGIVYLM